MNKTVLGGIGIVLALILGFVGAFKHSTSTLIAGGTSPEISSPYLSWGGVPHWAGSTSAMIQASSTACAIQSPNATSTPVLFAARFTSASSSAISLELGYSSSPAATTTKIGATYAIAANAQATVIASSTSATVAAGDKITLSPNQYLVAKFMGSGDNSGSAPVGTCEAEFTQVN